MQNQNASSKATHPAAPPNLHEIRTAENSAAYLLPTLQSLKESNDRLKLLDVGSGSGTVSISFAKFIPNGHVTGIDLNEKVLQRAQANAEKAGIKNIKFQQGSTFKLPFPDETFDVAHCHQVLIHVPNPWEGLREMLRVTKKGGIVAAREGDYETEAVWPELPGLQKFHKLMAGVMATPTAGRQLVSWALEAGAERSQVALSFSIQSYSTLRERSICSQTLCDQLRGGGLREKALKLGLATEDGEDFEEMAKAWEEWAGSDNASLAMMHGEILIQK
ncbi:MAG: hypothetical protein M1821_008545 [Bathelium mastoideum]|nr:MAG: hypothetical protein M1821_008545 [Bathelium mastoideum]